MRRVITHARERCTSKNVVSPSHQASSFPRSAASRFPLNSAYFFMNSIRVSCAGSGGAPASIPSMLRNHKSSLTHWCTICSRTLRPRGSFAFGRTRRSSSRNSLHTPSTFTRSVSYVSTRKSYRIASTPHKNTCAPGSFACASAARLVRPSTLPRFSIVSRIHYLERHRRGRRAREIRHQVNPDVRPRGKPQHRNPERNRWVEHASRNPANRVRSHHHRKSDRQPVVRIARCSFRRRYVSTTNTSANVNRNSATSAGSVLNVIGAVAAPAFRNFTTSAANAAPTSCATMYGSTSFVSHLPRSHTPSVTAGLKCPPEICPPA